LAQAWQDRRGHQGKCPACTSFLWLAGSLAAIYPSGPLAILFMEKTKTSDGLCLSRYSGSLAAIYPSGPLAIVNKQQTNKNM
jgi:hypothetical protein